MIKLNIVDIKGKSSGELNLDTIPEGFEANKVLIARSLKRQLANARIPCGHVRGLSEVRGGGKKPFRQKGLGRSRQGSTRAIQWTGGAVAFGPQRNRNHEIGMNKKERSAALRHLIWSKIVEGNWFLFGDMEFNEPSTKLGRQFIESLQRTGKFVVIIPSDAKYDNFKKSLRNLPGIKILGPERLNTFDLLYCDTVISHEDAFSAVRATWKV